MLHKFNQFHALVVGSALLFAGALTCAQSLPPPIDQGRDSELAKRPLAYRPASQSITLGELAEVQAAAMRATALERMGYTTTPPPPKPKKVVAERPVIIWTLKPTVIWGTVNALNAEGLANGKLITIKTGQTLVSSETVTVKVKAVNTDSLQLSVTKLMGKKAPVELTHVLGVGQQLEQVL
jgi:hypothetical protein